MRGVAGLIIAPIVLVVLAILLLLLPPVQDVLRNEVESILSERTGTTVRIGELNLRFPLGLDLGSVFVAELDGDTLLYAGNIKVDAGPMALFGRRVHLDRVVLQDVRANVTQAADSSFNFDFILQAFAGPGVSSDQEAEGTGSAFEFSLGVVQLSRIEFIMDLKPSDLQLDVDLGELSIQFDRFDLDPMVFHVADLGLDNTAIHFRNKAGEPVPSSYPELTNPFAGLDLRTDRIRLGNVAFTMKTVDTGDSLWSSVAHAEIRTHEMDLSEQRAALEEIVSDGLVFGMLMRSQRSANDTTITNPPWLDQQDGFRYWVRDLDFRLEDLWLTNATFQWHLDSLVTTDQVFDPRHMVLDSVGLHARDIALNNEQATMHLKELQVRPGWNAQRAKLAFEIDATPASVRLRNGSLDAFGNSISFSASTSQGDLRNAYLDPLGVSFELDLQGELSLADLGHLVSRSGMDPVFPPSVTEHWITHVWLKGSGRTIEVAGLQLDGDQGSKVRAKGRMSNISDWPKSDFNLTVEEFALGTGLHQLVQARLSEDVVLPRQLLARGTVNGSGCASQAEVEVESDLGNFDLVANVVEWCGDLPEAVKIDLNARDVQLAQLIKDPALGPASFTMRADLDALGGPSRSGDLEFLLTAFTYKGNDLSGLQMDAIVRGDSLFMDLDSPAEAACLQFHAEGPWPGDSLVLQYDLVLEQIHFHELGLTDHELYAKGPINGRMAITKAGHGQGDLSAAGLGFRTEQNMFEFDRCVVRGLFGADSTSIAIQSDAIDLVYHANMALVSAGALVRDRLLGAFHEPYVFEPPKGRRIDVRVSLPGQGRFFGTLVPALKFIDLERLEGKYDSDRDLLDLDVAVTRLDHDAFGLSGLELDLNADGPQLNGRLHVSRITRDSLFLDDLLVESINAPGVLRTTLRVRDGEVDRYRIGVDLGNEEGSPLFHVHEDLILDRQKWKAVTTNAIVLHDGGLRTRDMFIRSGDQGVELRTEDDGTHLDITGFKLSTITGLVRDADSLALVQGTLDATMVLSEHMDDLSEADVRISGLEVMDVQFGTVEVMFVSTSPEHHNFELSTDHPKNRLIARGTLDRSGTMPRIAMDAKVGFGDLAIFGPLVDEYLFELGGALDADLHYTQEGDEVAVLGYAAFKDARIGPVQTGSVYSIPSDTLQFDRNSISMKNIEVFDGKGNGFQLDGRIFTKAGTVPSLDLRLRTDRFLLVDNTIEKNPTFHGKLFGSIDLKLGGNMLAPTVNGEVGVLDSTALTIVLPGTEVEMIDHEGIVLFTDDLDATMDGNRTTDGEMLRDSLAAQLPGVELDLRVRLDPKARFAIIVDPTTGDQANFRAEADLIFRYDREKEVYLQGPFTVVEGGYALEFYGLVKKRFEFVPGGTIIWNGDPLEGRMDVQAKYSTTAAPYPLVSNARGGLTEGERNTLQARLPFDVLIDFSSTIQEPSIAFGLDMDQQVRNSYPQVDGVLDQLSKPANQEELNRQVFGLLVLSTFIENENASDQGGSGLGTTAATNSVNGILTQQLNRLTGEGIKGMSIELGVNTYDQTEGGQSYSRTTVDYKVTQRILNDRLSFEAGGSMGSNETNQSLSGVSNTNAPQYAIAYSVTPDGQLRLRLYHENAYDMYDGELVNNGVAIMISRDFEKNGRERAARRKEILQQREDRQKEKDPE